MRKIINLLMVALLAGGCATMYVPKPITNSFGSSDLAKYKTFTVASASVPNTPQFLRDLPMLQNVAFRFQQEGFQFISKIDKADFVIVMYFMDAVGQDYIPPRTYTSVSYDPGTTTMNTTGTITGMGNFVNLQANSVSNSTASATATTTTTGGYFVPNYGVAVALNIYDVKTKTLVWSGAGASRSSIQNITASVDNIILELIDKNLITPVYLKGEREKIRNGSGASRQNEFLKPAVSSDKLGYYQGTYKDNVAGAELLISIKTQGRVLILFFSVKNNTVKEIEFDPANLRLIFQDDNLYIFNKSEIADIYFKSKGSVSKKWNPMSSVLSGVFGILAGAGEALENSVDESQNKKIDKSVKEVYKNYLEKHIIKPGESYMGYLHIAGPMVLSENEKVKVVLPLWSRNVEVEFLYEKNWFTEKDYLKKYLNK